MNIKCLTKIADKIPCKDKLSIIGRKVASKSPVIFMVGGTAAVIGGVVMCSVKTRDVVDEYRSETDILEISMRDEIEDEVEREKAVNKGKVKIGLKCARHYVIPASVTAGGIAMMIASRNIEHRRLLLVSSAYDSLLSTYMAYRERVIANEGMEADARYIFGETDVINVEETTTKSGKKKTKETVVKVLDEDGQSMLHRLFDEHNSREAERNLIYNYDYVSMNERLCDQMLQARGYLFLDEVYRMLGFDLDGYSKTKLVGWIYDPTRKGEKQVDFGLSKSRALYENSYGALKNAGIWLTFNVDGVIIDKI